MRSFSKLFILSGFLFLMLIAFKPLKSMDSSQKSADAPEKSADTPEKSTDSLVKSTETSEYSTAETTEIKDGFKKYYEHNHVKGSFVLYDQKNNKYIVYNQPDITRALIPASTFKICNSLIALETGVVKDEHVTFKWDGKARQIPAWNADTDMKQAFRNSTVWYYQEIAKRVGAVRMKQWLDKVKYGNADTTGGIDGFWLWGKLRITPMQQIDFLKRLHDNKLPFSKHSMNIVKEIMIAREEPGYILRAKTGNSKQDNESVGWYVGYVTVNDNVYYFANCIQSENGGAEFRDARESITFDILNELNIIKK